LLTVTYTKMAVYVTYVNHTLSLQH